jgi:hypothetical protein
MKRHLIDLHIHSNFSDGKLNIAEIVDLYGSKGYSAIAITDHLADTKTLTGRVTRKLNMSLNERNMDQYLSTLQSEARRALEKYGMHLIAGLEITLNSWSRAQGAHIVFLNVDGFINPNDDVETLLKKNKKYFSIAAHPLWEKAFEFKTTYLWENRERFAPLFDAWECATAHRFSEQVYLSGYPIVASSDFHGPQNFESWKTQVYTDDLDPEILFDCIKNKEVEPIWA